MLFSNFLKQRNDEEAKKAEKKAAEIRQASGQLQKIREKMQAAAAAGKQDEYNKLDDEARKIKNNIFVMESARDPGALTAEEIRDAWKKYAAEYNKLYKAQFEKYQAAKKALKKELRELAEIQNAGQKEAFKCPEWLQNDAKRSLSSLDVSEAKKSLHFLADLIEYHETEGLKGVFSGSVVEDIDTEKSLSEKLAEVSRQVKKEHPMAYQMELQKRSQIIEDIQAGRKDITAITWLPDDLPQEEKEDYYKTHFIYDRYLKYKRRKEA